MSELSKLRKTLNMKNESDNNGYNSNSQASIEYMQEKLKNAGAGKYTDDRPDTVYSYSSSAIKQRAAQEAAQKAAQESKKHMDNSSLDELKKERNSSRWDYAKTAVSTPFKQLKNKVVDKSESKSAQIKADLNNAKKAYYQADDIYNQKKEQEDERKNTEIAKIIEDNQLSGLLDDVYTSQQTANADKSTITSPDSLNAQKATQTRQLLENKLKSIDTGEYNTNDFINYYNAKKNLETTKNVTDKVSSFSEKHPVSTEIARVVTSPLGAVSNVHNSLNSIATTKPMGWTNFLTTARYGVKEGIENRAADDNLIQLQGAHIGNILKVNDNNELEIMGNNFGNINSALYDNIDQSAEVVFDSLLLGGGITGGITKGAASLATQAGINALFSSSTMGDSITQQLLNNTEAKEAYKSGLKDALINFGTEMAGGPLEWVGYEGNSTLGKILVSGFNEASEEVIGNWIDRISDELINGHSSEAQQAYQELINQGYSESEAAKRVFKNMLAEDIFASLQAGLAGATMTGSDIAAKSVSQAAAYYDEGKDLNQNPSVATDVVNRGLQSSTDSKAFQIASDLSENYNYDKQRFNNYKLGKLQELNSIEGGNSYLSEAISNESNAEELLTIYNKAANGATINKREANTFVNSDFVKNIITENNIEAKNNVELAKKAVSVISSIGASVNDIQTKTPTLSEQSKQAADNFKQKHFNQGTAVQTKQGEKVNITTIAQTGDSVLFNTTDNKIINANDINWNDEQREMLVNSAKAYSPKIAMNYINGYDSDNGTLSQYNTKFNTYLRLVGTEGYTAEDAAIKLSDMGMPLTDIEAARFEEAGKQFRRELNTISQFKGQTKRVAPVQSKSVANNDYDRAYEKATDKKTADKLTKILKGKTKKGSTDLTSGASEFEKLQMNVISKVAEDNNIQVIFVNNTETLGYGEKNGFRTPDGKIVLALNNQGGLMTAYFGHELCHDLEGTNAYSALESEVMKYLAKTYGDENLQKRIDGIMQSQNLSEQSAKAEIVANSCMTVFDENFITNFAKAHTKEARTIKDWFNRLVARIRQAMDKVKKYVTEYRAISDDVAEIERIRDLFNAALSEKNSNGNKTIIDENEKVKFSVKQPVEETKDLIAIHNTTEEKLLKSLQLGGLPMPSIAIMKAENTRGNDGFGDISLVFPKSTIDPSQNAYNKVYGGDAWTPVYPTVEYKINEEKANEIYSRAINATKDKYAYKLNPVYFHPSNLEDTINRYNGERGLIDHYKNDYGMKQLYLAEIGKPVKEVKVKETRTVLSDEQVKIYDYLIENFGDTLSILDNGTYPARKWIDENGTAFDNARRGYYRQIMPEITEEQIDNIFNSLNEKPIDKIRLARQVNNYRKNGKVSVKTEQDNAATQKEIDSRINQKEYEVWIKDLFSDIAEKKGIRNNLDPYTSSGNMRSFEQLHYEETLENVVKQMRTQNNGDVSLFSGLGIWGVAAKNYGTMEQMKSDSFRLQNLSEEEFGKIKQGFGERLGEISESLENKYKNDNFFIDVENKMTNIIDALRVSKTKSGILKYLKQYFKNASESTVDDLLDLVADIGNMPVDYFEAKPQRAVYFNEVYNAVIPDNSSDTLKNALANAGINYSEYKAGDNDSRAEVLNSMDSIKFSDKVSNDDVFDDIFDIDDEDDIIALTEDLREMIKLSGQNARQISTSELSNAAKQIGLYKVFEADNAEAQKTAAALRKSYDSKYNKQLLTAQLSSLYEYMYNSSDIDYDYIWQRAKETAANIASGKNYVDDSVYRENLDVRKYIRGQVLKVPQNTINDFGAEEFIDFKKQARGKMRLSTEYGVSIDSLYKELHDMSEYYFPEVNEDGQYVIGNEQAELEQILDFFEATQKVYHNGAEEEAEDSGMTIDQYTNVIATDILYRFTMIEPVVKSYESTQNEARMKELQSSYQSKMQDLENKYKEEYEERYNQILAESDAKIAELDKEIASLNDENDKIKKDVALAKRNATLKTKALAKQKAHAKEVSKNATERRKASNLRRKIGNVGNTLKSKLLNPTDNSYVPEYLINSIAEVCTQINKSQMYWKNGNEKKAKPYLESLIAQYESLRNDSDFDYRDEYDSEISLYLSELNKKIGNKQLSQLSANELNDIYEIVKSIKNSLIDATKQIGRDTAISNYQSRKKIINEVMNSQGMRNKVVGEYEFWTLNPMRFVRMMSDYEDNAELNRQFKELEKGQRKSYKVMYDLSNSLNKLQENKKEFKRFTHDKIETNLIDTNGNKVIMTPAQIAQVYMTAQRQQGLTHLMSGGINIYDIESLAKGKSGDGTVNKAVIVPHILVEDINALYDLLTDYDKSWISAAKQTFEDSKSFINETSLVLKHRKLAKGNNYIPLEVDSEDRQNEISGLTFDATLEGNGALKAVNPNAGQRLIIRGLPMVLDKHISFVSSYAGLAIPIRNFKKVYGGTLSRNYDYNADNIYTVKAAINKKWTTSNDTIGTNLVEQAIADLESRREVDRAKLTSKIQSLWVQYTLAGNISVTLKQAASYPTAGAILSDYALKEAMKQEQAWKDTETLYNEIDSHTGIHYIRRLGLSVQEIAELSQDSNALVNKVPDKWQNALPSNWIQAMDVRTTATLWIACKLEVEKNNPKVAKGSQAYWDKVTELYEDVIEYTQPNYDSLHRGEIQKNTNAALRMFNMFKTQTLQNAGLVYDSYGEWMYFRKKGEKGKANAAAKKFMRVAQTQTIAALILVAMTLFSNVIKHKLDKYRDDDDKITWLSILKACSNDVLATLFTTVLPIGASELQGFYDSAKNIWKGQRGFDIVQFPAVTALNDSITSVLDLIGFAKKLIDGKAKAEQFEKVAMNFLGIVGGISQIPVKNLYLILKGIIEWVKDFSED